MSVAAVVAACFFLNIFFYVILKKKKKNTPAAVDGSDLTDQLRTNQEPSLPFAEIKHCFPAKFLNCFCNQICIIYREM